jgi:3-phenylpropionate/cinnamic acid dioxygenase small subunit
MSGGEGRSAVSTVENHGAIRDEVEAFVLGEAKLLDERRFRDWMGLFTPEGTYWVPAVVGQTSPFNQASLFYDDHDLMTTRVNRLEHSKIHIQSPKSHTLHHVGRVLVEAADEKTGEYLATSTLIMVESRADSQRFFAGRQYHRLRRDADGFRIIQKRVDLVNCDAPFEAMAVPI